MKRTSLGRMLFTFVFASSMPIMIIAGCKKPPPPAPDADPPPVALDSGPMILAPLDDDAGDAAVEADAKHVAYGPGMNPNEAKVRACCARLQGAVSAAGIAATPEMKAFVGQCNAIAAAVHTNPNAPELSGLKSIPGC